MLKLGVNIDHVATLRQARRTAYPDLLAAARTCRAAGADGITIHLREDRRHIQEADVRTLRAEPDLPLNLEMANVPEILRIALAVLPDEVCLVPERREELTTEGGLDAAGQSKSLKPTVAQLREAGVAVSLFIEADRRQIDAAAGLGAPYIELHTGRYCDLAGDDARRELDRLIEGARYTRGLGLRVNAGHGINVDNLPGILEMPHLDTLNIGHSIVCRSVFAGLETAVREMIAGMRAYRGGRV